MATKLTIILLFVGQVVGSLRSEVSEVADQARQLAVGDPVTIAATDLLYPPIVSTSGLVIAVVLSVFKPWDPIRDARPPRSWRPPRPAGPDGSAAPRPRPDKRGVEANPDRVVSIWFT